MAYQYGVDPAVHGSAPGGVLAQRRLEQYYAKYGITPPKQSDEGNGPGNPNVVEPCYDGASIIFRTEKLDLVEVTGRAMVEPFTWVNLTAPFFDMPAPPLDGSGGSGGSTPPPPPPAPTPDPKETLCKSKKASCEKIADYWYQNAKESCNGIKPGLPGMDFLVEPVVSSCKDGALENFTRKQLACDLAFEICMRS